MTLTLHKENGEVVTIETLPITAVDLNTNDPMDVFWDRIDQALNQPTEGTDENTDGRV